MVNATNAIRELDRAGQPITFQAVAVAAGVSRSWLYRNPQMRAGVGPVLRQRSRGQLDIDDPGQASGGHGHRGGRPVEGADLIASGGQAGRELARGAGRLHAVAVTTFREHGHR